MMRAAGWDEYPGGEAKAWNFAAEMSRPGQLYRGDQTCELLPTNMPGHLYRAGQAQTVTPHVSMEHLYLGGQFGQHGDAKKENTE